MKRQGGGGGEKELEYQYTAGRRRPQSAKKGGRGAAAGLLVPHTGAGIGAETPMLAT